MERGRQRCDDARHAGRGSEGDEDEAGRKTGRRVDQNAWEESGTVHPDPQKGDRRSDRKGTGFPAEHPGLPGAVQGRIGGAGPAAQIHSEGPKRQRADPGT